MEQHETRSPTIRDVARLAQVGIMTVSRVLNNHPTTRLSTRSKVESAVAKLGYRQNEAARIMKGRRAKTIGLIVPDLSDQFFATCAHTIQHIAREHGYMTLVVSSERDVELEVEQARLMSDRMLSGLLIASSAGFGDDRLRQLQSGGLVIVAFDRPLVHMDTDAVVVENRTGADEATRHLIEHGHTRIACVGYDEDTYTVRERMAGFRSRMLAHGLEPQTMLGLRTLDASKDWVRRTMLSKKRPTAVFALNHRISSFLLRAFEDQNVRVPRDMALIGFDDFDLADIVFPALTAVAQSPVELAHRSIHLLLDRLRGEKTAPSFVPAKIILPTRLIVRDSCGVHE